MNVYILGGSGHAKVVVATAQAAGRNVLGIFDDDPARYGATVLGVPIIGPIEQAQRMGAPLLMAIGSNATRQRLVAALGDDVEWSRAIHPHASVHPSVVIGVGTVIMAGAVVQPEVVLGRHVIVNTGASVDHDSTVCDYAHLAPGVRIAGGICVEEGAFMGIGSCAIPGVIIGAWACVGAGAVVTRRIPPGITAVGIPARPLAKSPEAS